MTPAPISSSCRRSITTSMTLQQPRECRRVLRRDGVVCVRNGTRQLNFPQRPFFPQLEPLIESQLPSREDIERVFIDARFSAISRDVVTQVVASDWRSFVEKSAFRADSFLARLSDRDFEQGIAAMRSPGAVLDPDAPVTEEIDWFVFGGRGSIEWSDDRLPIADIYRR
jgi:hypothetical protein